MNYLRTNLNNSSILPYDMMKLIHEYADPLNAIKKQIETADYDLDETMYKRMKKHLKIHIFINDYLINEYYLMDSYETEFTIDRNNIDDPNLKNACINEYKHLFLYKHKENTPICGISNYISKTHSMELSVECIIANPWKTIMINFKPNEDEYESFYIKGLYKIWVKL